MGEKERTAEKWIGIASVLVGMLGVVATITVPEVRRVIGLRDNPQERGAILPNGDPRRKDVISPTVVQPPPSPQSFGPPQPTSNGGLPKGAIGVPEVDSQLVEMWRQLDQINAVPNSNHLPR